MAIPCRGLCAIDGPTLWRMSSCCVLQEFVSWSTASCEELDINERCPPRRCRSPHTAFNAWRII